MMKKVYSLALALALLIGAVGCAKEEALSPKEIEAIQPQGERITLSIDSEFDLANVPGNEETARSLQLGQSNGIPHIKLPLGETTKLRVFLRKIGATGDAATTSAYLPAKVSYDSSKQRYRIVAYGDVQLQQSTDRLDQGEWYIAALWDGASPSTFTTEEQRLTHTLTAMRPINAQGISMDRPVSIQVPVVTKWTRIDNSKSGGKTLTNLGLEFTPMGVLLALNLSNQTIYEVNVSSMKAGFKGFAIDGKLTTKGVSDTQLRSGASLELVESSNEDALITPSSITMQPFSTASSPVYLWLYPKKATSTGEHSISFTFASEKRNSQAAGLEAKDIFGESSWTKELQDFYTVDYVFQTNPRNGTYYRKDYGLSSQLSITEIFVQNYQNRAYGYIEIYNPNTRPVVLENYGLIRIIDGPSDGTKHVRMGYYYPQNTSIQNTDGRTHETSVLSLGMKAGASPWKPNSLGFNSSFEIAGSGAPEAPMSKNYADREEVVRFIKSKPTTNSAGKYTLEGGKTMLVLLAGHLAHANSTLQDPIPGNNEVPGLPEYINRAFDKGYCQYIVALNNPVKGKTTISEIQDLDAGVTNLAYLDAVALVQKHTSNQVRRRAVDATSLSGVMYLANGDWPYYRSYVATGVVHFRSRTTAQHTSDSHFHTYRQFYQARLGTGRGASSQREYLGDAIVDANTGKKTIPLPSKVVAPGTRRYVGNTEAAWNALPEFNVRTHANP